jgi:hypothetical protein
MNITVTVTEAEVVAYGRTAIKALFPNSNVIIVISDASSPPPTPGHTVTSDPPLSATGEATLFGINYDGSVDGGDNGQGFFKDPSTGQPYQTRSKTLAGVSLPREVMLSTFLGITTTNPIDSVWGAHAGAVQEYVTKNNPLITIDSGGKTAENVPLVDAGPSASTGNALDLTYFIAHALETNGKAIATYEILVGGKAIEIKNWPINA